MTSKEFFEFAKKHGAEMMDLRFVGMFGIRRLLERAEFEHPAGRMRIGGAGWIDPSFAGNCSVDRGPRPT